MKIYFANMFGCSDLEKYLRHKINVLAAFTSFNKNKIIELPEFCQDFFLDSGAYGKNSDKIQIEGYVNFIKKNKNNLNIYANLDVIGDSLGTWKNQRFIEKNNLFPLPVFHYGEKIKWLKKLLNNYDYIALGGMVPISQNLNALCSWLNKIWDFILNSDNPNIKVHGFGIQNFKIIEKYPWYSVDASSVHMQARYGGILTPYGWIKINPEVNPKELRWGVGKPLQKTVIKKFVENYIDGFSYEDAGQKNKEGILIRCAISIHYITEKINKINNKELHKLITLL